MTDTMTMTNWSWMALLALGAFHGINPGMGWLFAVALGMQERRRTAVWRAMLPLAAGHALAIVAAVAVVMAVGQVVPIRYVQYAVAAVLIGFGISRLIRHRHPRWTTMRVSMKDLTVWSFLMATAHGAGLMVLPLFLGTPESAHAAHSHHAHHSAAASLSSAQAALMSGVHTMAYLFVTCGVAALVYEKLGVGMLRKAWFNLDLIWPVALIVSGVVTIL
jgi:hypothetical protein